MPGAKKLAVVFCAHHKPWLIMSTLISLAMQDYNNYDIYFLYQTGDGACPNKKTYFDYFRLAEKCGVNVQLSPFDERVKNMAAQFKSENVYSMELENDHALDSGAWYKFIRTQTWKKYDYVFFIQEGALFTGKKVLSSAIEFAENNSVDFLSSGHEKRRIPKNIFMNYNSVKANPSEMDYYHDEKIRESFGIFCRDVKFQGLYDRWSSDFKVITQNHVPEGFSSLRERLLWFFLNVKRMKIPLLHCKSIYENSDRRYLEEVVKDYRKYKNVIFHKENSPEWFGCSCQHLFSHKLLDAFSQKLTECNMYDVLDLPFSGTALEVIWGFLPPWLGFDKWFFDGIHRVRKNFVNYKREDTPEGMCHYINRYYRNQIQVFPSGDFIKIHKLNLHGERLKDILGESFF